MSPKHSLVRNLLAVLWSSPLFCPSLFSLLSWLSKLKLWCYSSLLSLLALTVVSYFSLLISLLGAVCPLFLLIKGWTKVCDSLTCELVGLYSLACDLWHICCQTCGTLCLLITCLLYHFYFSELSLRSFGVLLRFFSGYCVLLALSCDFLFLVPISIAMLHRMDGSLKDYGYVMFAELVVKNSKVRIYPMTLNCISCKQ